MEFAEKLGPKYVFGRKIARRRNYEARTGRSILKRQGLGGRPSPFGLKMAEKLKTLEKCCFWMEQRHKIENWGGPKIGGIVLRSRRFSDRLNRSGETPNLGPPELTNHRRKHKNNNNKVLISRQISKFLNQVRSFTHDHLGILTSDCALPQGA